MPRRQLLASSVQALLLGALISCGGGQDFTKPEPVARVTLNPRTWSLVPGATFQFTAELRGDHDQLVGPRAIVWSSSDPSKVSVSATGVVRGIAPGHASITATAEGLSGGASVVVDSASTNLSGPIIPVRPPASP
jgi:uncharacterized protein YjdB